LPVEGRGSCRVISKREEDSFLAYNLKSVRVPVGIITYREWRGSCRDMAFREEVPVWVIGCGGEGLLLDRFTAPSTEGHCWAYSM
jgi:hypothetical protein